MYSGLAFEAAAAADRRISVSLSSCDVCITPPEAVTALA
jgi:hypothetical protein